MDNCMIEDKTSNVVESFKQYFSVDLAVSEEQRINTYKIRYRVYGEEFGYEETDSLPEHLEKDDYDDSALNCLITHLTSGLPAACVRIIRPNGSKNLINFPFENAVPDYLSNQKIRALKLSPDDLCEVSRLAVDGAFRRRSGEKASRFGEINGMDISRIELRTFNLISVATTLAGLSLAKISGATYMLAMMEPFLPRILDKSGIHFDQISETINYHGKRALYFSHIVDNEKTIIPELLGLYREIDEKLYSSINSCG